MIRLVSQVIGAILKLIPVDSAATCLIAVMGTNPSFHHVEVK